MLTSDGEKAACKQHSCFSKSYCVTLRCSPPTRLVSVPVGVGNLVPGEPAVGAATGLVAEADPEGFVRTAEHQAAGEGLLEPFKGETSQIIFYCLFLFKAVSHLKDKTCFLSIYGWLGVVLCHL